MSFLKFLAAFLFLVAVASLALVTGVFWPDHLVPIVVLAIVLMVVGVVALEIRFPSVDRSEQPDDRPGKPQEAGGRKPVSRDDSRTSWLSTVRVKSSSENVEALVDRLEVLEEEKDRLERIADGSHAGIVHIDGDGRFVYANARLLGDLGLERVEDLKDESRPFEVEGAELSGFPALARYLSEEADRDVEFSFLSKGMQRFFMGRASRTATGRKTETTLHLVDVTERTMKEIRNRYYASHDALTGTFNRIAFLVDLDNASSEGRKGRGFALIAIDLDRFKPINDTHGHSAGDTVLQVIAARLKALVEPDGAVYRIGGDEFSVILFEEDVEATRALAERVLSRLSEPIQAGRVEVSVGASIGIAFMPEDTHSARTLVELADAALYASKSSGGRRIVLHSETVDEIASGTAANDT